MKTARECGSTEAEANSLINLIHDYILVGEAEKARAALRDVEAIRDRDPWHQWRFFGIRFQEAAAQYWLWQGSTERAEQHARALLENAISHRVPKYNAIAHGILAQIAITRGDTEGADSEFSKALDALREYPANLVQWKILAALGRFRSQSQNLEGAREAYSSAALVIDHIATHISDEGLRSTYLSSDAVQEALEGSGGFRSVSR